MMIVTMMVDVMKSGLEETSHDQGIGVLQFNN